MFYNSISIHAPVKGATIANKNVGDTLHIISIHAPVKGATYKYVELSSVHLISIHAPVKGATEIFQTT